MFRHVFCRRQLDLEGFAGPHIRADDRPFICQDFFDLQQHIAVQFTLGAIITKAQIIHSILSKCRSLHAFAEAQAARSPKLPREIKKCQIVI